MASNNVGTLSVQTVIDASGMQSGAQKAIASAKTFESAVGSIFGKSAGQVGQHMATIRDVISGSLGGGTSSISTALGAITGFTGIGALGGVSTALTTILGTAKQIGESLNRWVDEGLAALKMQDKISTVLGTTREQAAGLISFGQQIGVDAQTLMNNGQRVLVEMGQLRASLAGGGTGGASGSVLRSLGIDVAAFSTRNLYEQLGILGDRLRTLPNASDRAEASMAILGRQFRDFAPFLAQGSAGLQRIEQDARTFGVTVDNNVNSQLSGTRAEMMELRLVSQMAGEGIRNSFAAAFQDARMQARGSAREIADSIRSTQPQIREAVQEIGQFTGGIRGQVERFGGNVMLTEARAFRAFNLRDMMEGAGLMTARPDVFGTASLSAGLANQQSQGQVGPPTEVFQTARAVGEMSTNLERELHTAQDSARDLSLNLRPGTSELERQLSTMQGLTEEQRRQLLAQHEAVAVAREQGNEQARQRAQAEASMAQVRQLAQQAMSPFDKLHKELLRFDNSGLTDEQRGRLIRQAVPRQEEAPLLGSMTAGGSDIASIIQGSMSPQVNAADAIRGAIEASREDAARHRDEDREIGRAIRDYLQQLAQAFAN